MKPWKRWTLLALVLLAVVVLTLLWTGQRGVRVQTLTAETTAIEQSVVATGRINARARVDVASEITATVESVSVREGALVRTGEVLVQLNDAEARAAVEQARSALAEARGRLTQQAGVGAPVARQAVLQAEAAFLAAQAEHRRVQELVQQGFFSRQRLDESQRSLDTTRSALESARIQDRAQQAGGLEADLAQTRVAQAQAALEAAQARWQRHTLRSPFDARVLARHIEPGGTAQPGKPLLSLASMQWRIDAGVDEKHLRVLKGGMSARAVADAYPGQPFDAVLEYIAPSVDAQRGTVEVRLSVPQPPEFLRPDLTVSVELLGGRKAEALVLTAAALRDAQTDAPWVLVVRDGRAERQPVQLGLRGVGVVEVVQGLQAGTPVIPATEKALPGDRVRAQPASTATRPMDVPGFVNR